MVPWIKHRPLPGTRAATIGGLILAKHLARAAVRRKGQHRRRAARLAIGTGSAVLAVLAVGLQADGSFSASGQTPGVAGTTPDAASAIAQNPDLGSAALSASADARLAYTRSTVRTEARKETAKVSVSSAPVHPAAGTLEAPLPSLVPSSLFGLRTSPITGSAGEFHWGLDFSAACGTGVYAADTGVVRAVGWHPWGGGNRVEIDHGNGLITTYNHLAVIGVRTGQHVQAGELIAQVGTTGASTGCHLHFETILNGTYTDPAKWPLQPLHPADSANTTMTDYQKAHPAANSVPWTVPGASQLNSTAATEHAQNPSKDKAQEPGADNK